MHDPHTLIWSIPNPFCKRRHCQTPLVLMWHVDPESDGTDDSCDWFNRGKSEDREDPKRLAVYEALWDLESILDNRPHYPGSKEHRAFQPLKLAIRNLMAPPPRPKR